MQRLTCVMFINLAHYYGKRPCQAVVNSRFRLVSFPDQWVAVSDPTPVRPEICTELYIERCVCVNMHSEDAVSANGGSSTTQTSTLLVKCRRWIRSCHLFLLIFNLFCVNATFSSQNIRFTPLSGYEIGSKHPPIDSAPLIWSEDVLWCTYFQVVSSGFAIKMCLLHVSIKKKAIHRLLV